MLIGLVGIIIFGLTLPATKVALDSFSPAFISFGRAAIAGLIGLFYLLWRKEPIPQLAVLKKLLILVVGIVIAFPYLMTLAMANGSSAHGGIILGFMPIVTTVIGVIKFKERPSWGFWFASLLGTGLVLLYALIQGSGQLSRMDYLLMLAAFFSSAGYAQGAELARTMNPKVVISWAVVLSLPINLIVTAITYEPEYLHSDLPQYLGLLFVGIFSMYIGFFFWYEGLALGGIARVSQVQLIQPFVTLIGSAIFLSEKLTRLNVIFAVLVVLSILLGKTMLIKKAHS